MLYTIHHDCEDDSDESCREYVYLLNSERQILLSAHRSRERDVEWLFRVHELLELAAVA